MFLHNNSFIRERHTLFYVIKTYIDKRLINIEECSKGHGDSGMYMKTPLSVVFPSCDKRTLWG